ncbi:MAG: NAD-dependent epimerase/dehydratase family protein [Spartobacteria bacterium]|nr:NAD-dependent epimerase/dehydratase family protein [Spartobacteria bacterium]
MKLAITGATGFIGSHVVDQALARGYKVRILTRRPITREDWLQDNVEVFHGDVRDAATLKPFLTGMDYLCNVAGVNTPASNQRENIFSSNVDGVKQILTLASECGISRMIHTGSTAALGCSGKSLMNDENTEFNLWNASTDYERSKYLGEKAALQLHKDHRIPVIIAEPAACVGPGDVKPTYTGKLIIDFITGKLPGYFDIRHNYVDVRDVALGHLLALENGRPGQRYLLCGDDNILMSEYFGMISAITGVSAPKLKLPLWIVLPMAYGFHALWRLTKKDPFVRVSTVKRAMLDLYYSNNKAKEELGYTPHSLKKALFDEISWFKTMKYIPEHITVNSAS